MNEITPDIRCPFYEMRIKRNNNNKTNKFPMILQVRFSSSKNELLSAIHCEKKTQW